MTAVQGLIVGAFVFIVGASLGYAGGETDGTLNGRLIAQAATARADGCQANLQHLQLYLNVQQLEREGTPYGPEPETTTDGGVW